MKPSVITSFLLAVLAGLAGAAPPFRFERSLDSMGTTYTVVLYGEDRFALDAAVDAAFEETGRLDELLSNYRPESEWSRLNREAASRPVEVSKELFDLLSQCLEYSRRSEGSFDITVGPLMQLWGFFRGSGRVPHRAEIRAVQARVGYRHIQLDPARRTVRFTRAGVNLDPGGIGKGYAVDRMVEILRRQGVTSGFITAGRSSMFGLGTPPGEPRGWRVEIPHPRRRGVAVAELFLKNESMATSGTSERFFVAGGATYSHIMDPRTGKPAQGMLSVSVVAPRALDSEAWTKPFFVQGRAWTARHMAQNMRVFLCEDRLEIACVSLP
jgi:thiamine biosynthesis lipoprotein